MESLFYVSYTGVILDESSRNQLLAHVDWMFPSEYQRVAHHMTVCLGKLDPIVCPPDALGKPFQLKVITFGLSDLAAAVGVETDLPVSNLIPHITLGVNPGAGGKPKDSNFIANWTPVEFDLVLTGHLTEVKFLRQRKKGLPDSLVPECG